MRRYEAMYIVDADIPDESFEPVIEKYNKVVTDGGGEVVEVGKWEKGRRQMAYEIAKKREGMYLLMQFKSNAEVPKELDQIFKINDDVLRILSSGRMGRRRVEKYGRQFKATACEIDR